MFDATVNPPVINTQWSYLGGGEWTDQFGKRQGPSTRSDLLDFLAKGHLRPLRPPGTRCQKESDAPGSLVMFDLSANSSVASRDWFYNGNGVWTVGAAGDSPPLEGNLEFLSQAGRLSGPQMNLSPRPQIRPIASTSCCPSRRFTPTRSEPAYLMNTRSLVSSLQQDLPSILSASVLNETSKTKPENQRRYYFHVEAGITIAELGQLLAHQSPRLSLRAISGSPGATLAGALSTATHGAEFNWPLLIDAVKAVHLVGPGGVQWWIEGDDLIADPQKLRVVYPDIDPSRIIQGERQVGGVVPQDWLGAAVVSLGCLGVVYSVVLEVVPLFGVREVVVQKTWGNLGFLGSQFAGADISAALKDPATTKRLSARIVKLLQNGILSGTSIPQFDRQESMVNRYADLAINPIPRVDGSFDCWISNREVTAQLPLDVQPAASIVAGVAGVLRSEGPSAEARQGVRAVGHPCRSAHVAGGRRLEQGPVRMDARPNHGSSRSRRRRARRRARADGPTSERTGRRAGIAHRDPCGAVEHRELRQAFRPHRCERWQSGFPRVRHHGDRGSR